MTHANVSFVRGIPNSYFDSIGITKQTRYSVGNTRNNIVTNKIFSIEIEIRHFYSKLNSVFDENVFS